MKLWELMKLVSYGTRIEIYDRATGKLLAKTRQGLEKFTACYVDGITPKQKVEQYTGGMMLRPYLHVWVGMPED